MEDYLKDSNETRKLEQKVYKLDVQRYKLIIGAYKEKLEDLTRTYEEFVKEASTNTAQEVKTLQDLLKETHANNKELICNLEKEKRTEVEKLENELRQTENRKSKEIAKLSEDREILRKEIQDLKNNSTREIKSLKNELKDLKKKKAGEESETIKKLRNELKKAKVEEETELMKNLKKELEEKSKTLEQLEKREIPRLEKENKTLAEKLANFEPEEFQKVKSENSNLLVKVELLNEKCKSLEKEVKELKLTSKKKEEQWFKSIADQNQKLIDKLEREESKDTLDEKLGVITDEINKIGKSLRRQPVKESDDGKILENIRGILKKCLDEALSRSNDVKDKTIKTLKATNDLKTNIIKKQVEKISKSKRNIQSESSEDTIIKPEEDTSSVVFGLGELATDKKEKAASQRPTTTQKQKIEQNKKKVKTNSFDDAVLNSVKPKKPLPIVKKPHLPNDAQKLNNASFFANITFTDSSPVIKRDGTKKK